MMEVEDVTVVWASGTCVCARVCALFLLLFFIFLLAFNLALESVNSGQMVAFHGLKTGCSPGALL